MPIHCPNAARLQSFRVDSRGARRESRSDLSFCFAVLARKVACRFKNCQTAFGGFESLPLR
jgi:hypothetical protein